MASGAASGEQARDPQSLGRLESAAVELPDDAELFVGPDADMLNADCLACHSPSMIRTQPPLTRDQWNAVVIKMQTAYRAPVAPAEIEPLTDALVRLKAAG